MKAKKNFTLASSLVVVLLIILFVFLMQAKKSYTGQKIECQNNENAQCITPQGYTGYKTCENGAFSQCFVASLDDCPIKSNQLFSVCCKSKEGNLYGCNEKKDFNVGDYVIVKTNLQLALKNLGSDLDSYKTCGFSSLISGNSEVPEHYEKSTAFYDPNAQVGCSNIFYAKDFHQGSIAGFVPNAKGKIKISEWRVYPDTTELSEASDAIKNFGKSFPVFLLEVNVGG